MTMGWPCVLLLPLDGKINAAWMTMGRSCVLLTAPGRQDDCSMDEPWAGHVYCYCPWTARRMQHG